jgi:phage replication initiation protein
VTGGLSGEARASEPRSGSRGALPPSSNTGGKALSVSTDWLAFSYMPSGNWVISLQRFLHVCFGQVGWVGRKNGWQGYEYSAHCGAVLVAWGGVGQQGTVHVEIPGTVCGACDGWPAVVAHLQRVGARITRCDIAGDDFNASVVSVSRAKRWYRAGRFTSGGRPPCVKLIDDMGSGDGCTFYVGRRENGKVLRIYEKGLQLGCAESPWVRAEVELRAKDRVIPLDVLLRPEDYLAGAYEPLRVFSSARRTLRTVRERTRITFERAIQVARMHAGRVVNAILVAGDGDVGRVVDLLRRDGLPAGLNRADLAHSRST